MTTGVAVLSVLGVLAESPPARFARGHADPAATTGTAGIEELREARSREPGGWRRGRTSRRNLMPVMVEGNLFFDTLINGLLSAFLFCPSSFLYSWPPPCKRRRYA